MNKPMSDSQLAQQLNQSVSMGGSLTEYGIWYSENSVPRCMLFPLGRHWTAQKIKNYRSKVQARDSRD